jgi:pimeloyl-ACP methyl ester carboxylesterase
MQTNAQASLPDPGGTRLVNINPSVFQGLGGWLAIPPSIDPDAAPLVAVHGIGRDARNQAVRFGGQAASQGRMVIAPRFDETSWPGYQRLGARGQRADLALIRLLELVAFRWRVNTRRVCLFGYSGGAQFVHRFGLLHPHRVVQLNVCASGWFTWPTEDEPYPAGLGAATGPAGLIAQAARHNLSRFLQVPTQVFVGAQDCVADPHTRVDARINALQGSHRLERARRWVLALNQQARQRGLTPRATLTVLPGAGHDFRQCLASGALVRAVLPMADPHAADLQRAA